MAIPTANPLPDPADLRVQGLLQGHSWSFPGGSHSLSYALYSPFGTAWSAAASSALDQAFAAWSAVADLQFVKLAAVGTFNNAAADLPVSLVGSALESIGGGAVAAMGMVPDTLWIQSSSEFWAALAGYGISRAAYPRPEGDIYINDRSPAFSYLSPGGIGLEVFLHEIGHALGLKHPHDDGGAGRPTFSDVGMGEFDDGLWTLMSYDSPFGGSPGIPAAAGFQATPMPLDILAIQHLYGANMAYHAGNDTYVLRSDGVVRTLWDAGGVDTLDLRALAAPYQGVVVDLGSEGGWGIRTGSLSATYIAFQVRLENVFGTAGADTLIGNEADNWLDGGAGSDTLDGGAGNDTYVVDRAGDVVVMDAEGVDTVRSAVDWGLAPDLENLVLTGSAPLNGSGNGAANRIVGNGAANVLDGGGGPDTLEGGAGNDTYVVADAEAQILEGPSGGTDTVRTTVSWDLGATLENGILEGGADAGLTGNGAANALTGNAGANLLTGGGGNDSLDGGAGADLLVGGSGDDSYTLDDAGDVVVEETDGGIDTVFSAVSLLVPAHVENAVLLGGGSALLTGSGSDNRLSGGSGADTLDGGGGNDTLAGGGGDDTYLVRDGTIVSESGGGGVDTVVFTGGAGYLLGSGLEKLVLAAGTGTLAGGGGGEDNTLTGNGAANYLDGGGGNDSLYGLGGADVLIGGAGNDLLDGGRGIDRMDGGGGNDTYVVGHSLDAVLEAPGGGIDSVRMHLARYVLPENVENLIGDDGDNVLVGNGLANRLSGGGGHDHFVFAQAPNGGAIDTVTDFVSGQDLLVLGENWAGGLGGDGLRVGAGPSAAVAVAATDRLLYDSTTGSLYYDPDGTGAQAAVKFAVLEGSPAIAWTDLACS